MVIPFDNMTFMFPYEHIPFMFPFCIVERLLIILVGAIRLEMVADGEFMVVIGATEVDVSGGGIHDGAADTGGATGVGWKSPKKSAVAATGVVFGANVDGVEKLEKSAVKVAAVGGVDKLEKSAVKVAAVVVVVVVVAVVGGGGSEKKSNRSAVGASVGCAARGADTLGALTRVATTGGALAKAGGAPGLVGGGSSGTAPLVVAAAVDSP